MQASQAALKQLPTCHTVLAYDMRRRIHASQAALKQLPTCHTVLAYDMRRRIHASQAALKQLPTCHGLDQIKLQLFQREGRVVMFGA